VYLLVLKQYDYSSKKTKNDEFIIKTM